MIICVQIFDFSFSDKNLIILTVYLINNVTLKFYQLKCKCLISIINEEGLSWGITALNRCSFLPDTGYQNTILI